jgi:hypothetical protein
MSEKGKVDRRKKGCKASDSFPKSQSVDAARAGRRQDARRKSAGNWVRRDRSSAGRIGAKKAFFARRIRLRMKLVKLRKGWGFRAEVLICVGR